MPRLAICSCKLHWQWIFWALLYYTMEVSMLRLAWLTIAQHVFQPALTGRLELISRKIASCEQGTKAMAVSRFREKLSPANWVQGVTAISRKTLCSWAPKNGSNMRPRYIIFRDIHDRDISGVHCTSCATYASIISLKCTDTSELLYLLSFKETLLLCQIEDLQLHVYLATGLVLDAVICAHHTTLTTSHLEIHKQQSG